MKLEQMLFEDYETEITRLTLELEEKEKELKKKWEILRTLKEIKYRCIKDDRENCPVVQRYEALLEKAEAENARLTEQLGRLMRKEWYHEEHAKEMVKNADLKQKLEEEKDVIEYYEGATEIQMQRAEKAEVEIADLKLMNPCGHTGFESDSCQICGYPDSRKLIKYWKDRAEKAEKEIKILELKNRGTLANNLCPDHRDKQVGKPCLACSLEKAEARLEEEKEVIEYYRGRCGI